MARITQDAAMGTDFASLGVWSQEIDDFNAGNQNLLGDVHLNKLGSFSVDGGKFIRNNRAPLVDRLTWNWLKVVSIHTSKSTADKIIACVEACSVTVSP